MPLPPVYVLRVHPLPPETVAPEVNRPSKRGVPPSTVTPYLTDSRSGPETMRLRLPVEGVLKAPRTLPSPS